MKLYVLALFLIVALSGFLRFFQLATNPPGMYVDEASIGVNAYQILTTGKDEHGETMPLFFKAFGEYKLPVYIYLTSVSMLLFGKTEFAVRFTSALFGTATVLLIYYFLRTLMVFDKKSFTQMHRQALPFIGAVILAVTPWHIQFSRGGFEANVALFFFLLGIFCLLQYLLSKKELFLSCFFISLLITLYTYSTYRLLTPLLLIFVIGYLYSKKKTYSEFYS